MALGASAGALSQAIPFDEEEFWWGLISMLAGAGSYFLLSQQIAVSRLTFESDNRSSGIRIICTLQFWLLWAGVVAYSIRYGTSAVDDEVIVAFATMSSIHWLIAGLFFSTESDHISRRVRRSVSRFGLLRLLMAPWMPGGRRGLVLLAIHLLAVVIIGRLSLWSDWVHNTVTVGALYTFLYVAVGAAVGRLGQAVTPEFRPAHARVLTILMAALSMIAPYLPPSFGLVRWPVGYSLTEVTNPLRTLLVVSDSVRSAGSHQAEMVDKILMTLGIATALALLINLSAMFKGIQELVSFQPPTDRDRTPAGTGSAEAAPVE